MKKFSSFLGRLFKTNIGIKILSVVLALFVVIAINIPNLI